MKSRFQLICELAAMPARSDFRERCKEVARAKFIGFFEEDAEEIADEAEALREAILIVSGREGS